MKFDKMREPNMYWRRNATQTRFEKIITRTNSFWYFGYKKGGDQIQYIAKMKSFILEIVIFWLKILNTLPCELYCFWCVLNFSNVLEKRGKRSVQTLSRASCVEQLNDFVHCFFLHFREKKSVILNQLN